MSDSLIARETAAAALSTLIARYVSAADECLGTARVAPSEVSAAHWRRQAAEHARLVRALRDVQAEIRGATPSADTADVWRVVLSHGGSCSMHLVPHADGWAAKWLNSLNDAIGRGPSPDAAILAFAVACGWAVREVLPPGARPRASTLERLLELESTR